MIIRDEFHHAIDLRALPDRELLELAYDRPLSRAALVAVFEELRRRRDRDEPQDTPTHAR